jgi:hypothetical protein
VKTASAPTRVGWPRCSKSGAPVPVGNPRSKTDDVPVKLERNEIVMNRPAARAHAQQLNEWNRDGRQQMSRQGGMAVGHLREARR